MCEFLASDDLSRKIREVLKGKDARCAVAFWGLDAVKELFGQKRLEREDVHVICDLSMGGTNPKTLRDLGAPDNPNIMFRDGLHAKVFLSESGAVVGSANASNNGIGFMGGNAQLLEAGTYFAPESDAWRTISNWLADLSDSGSRQVDDEALNTAQLSWNRRCRAVVRPNIENDRNFLAYDPDVHGLLYVLWQDPTVEKPEYNVDDDDGLNTEKSHSLAPDDDDLRMNWICIFPISDQRLAHPDWPPEFFFANRLKELGVQDGQYTSLLWESTTDVRPNPPFNFEDLHLVTAFRKVIDNPQKPYGPLRGETEEDVWLAKDHVELMHRFWRDVQDEYRRRQAED